jgi:hypothetical protein
MTPPTRTLNGGFVSDKAVRPASIEDRICSMTDTATMSFWALRHPQRHPAIFSSENILVRVQARVREPAVQQDHIHFLDHSRKDCGVVASGAKPELSVLFDVRGMIHPLATAGCRA